MYRAALLLSLALTALGTVRADAQSASELLGQGIRAYQSLELDAAAQLLRQALAPRGDTLPIPDRLRAMMYLFAAEYLREHRDSATVLARRMVRLEPLYAPDQLVFPPDIVGALEEVRRDLKVVVARAGSPATFVPRRESFRVTLLASSAHQVDASITRDGGEVHRTLYRGVIEDTLELTWDGLDAQGADTPSGRYALMVSSRDNRGRLLRVLRRPLDFTATEPARTAVADPGEPGAPLARRSRASAVRALGTGAAVGAAVVALPGLIAPGEAASGTRFLVGGAIAVGGVTAFLTRRPGGHTEPGEVRMMEVAPRLTIRVGPPAVTEVERAATISREPGEP